MSQDAGPASQLTVCKLGGSVVTVKDEPETIDEGALKDAAGALKDATGPLVVVHGGGSFGHHHAADHGVTTAEGTADAAAVRAIHDAMVELNDAVVGSLQDHGLPALPIQPLSIAARDDAGELSLPTVAIEGLLEEGFVPVLHGDVVAHESEGVTVLSGDELVVRLAMDLDAARVGVCSTVPGVLDDGNEVVDRIERFEDVGAALGESDATDVTGGMAGKVRSLLELDAPAQVFGPADLAAFVDGEQPGTTIDSR